MLFVCLSSNYNSWLPLCYLVLDNKKEQYKCNTTRLVKTTTGQIRSTRTKITKNRASGPATKTQNWYHVFRKWKFAPDPPIPVILKSLLSRLVDRIDRVKQGNVLIVFHSYQSPWSPFISIRGNEYTYYNITIK